MVVDTIHKALASPVRRDILAWLKEPELHFTHEPLPVANGVCAGSIHRRCQLSQSTVSAHLSTLLEAGLVSCDRSGQWALFKRNETMIQAFREYIVTAL